MESPSWDWSSHDSSTIAGVLGCRIGKEHRQALTRPQRNSSLRSIAGALRPYLKVGRSRQEASKMTHFVKVARTDEIKPGQARLVDARGRQIALFNINGEFFAIDNMCTHEQASLAEGEISGHEVTCPLHGAKFDVRTGSVLGPPAYDDVACYSVRVMGTDIEVDVE